MSTAGVQIGVVAVFALTCSALAAAWTRGRLGAAAITLFVVASLVWIAGFAAELAAILAEKAILDLRGPVVRVTGYDVPYPYWQLEDAYLPSAERVVDAARRLLEV